MNNLQDLYVDQLQDLFSANRQAAKIVEKFAEKASEQELREKLEKSARCINEHNDRLQGIINDHDADPSGEHCKGMEGLVTEAKKHALETDFSDDAVRDAQIIAQYQRITHYGIAAYGTCRALAERLGYNNDESTLAEDLESVKNGDAVMNRIAEDSVNRKAAA